MSAVERLDELHEKVDGLADRLASVLSEKPEDRPWVRSDPGRPLPVAQDASQPADDTQGVSGVLGRLERALTQQRADFGGSLPSQAGPLPARSVDALDRAPSVDGRPLPQAAGDAELEPLPRAERSLPSRDTADVAGQDDTRDRWDEVVDLLTRIAEGVEAGQQSDEAPGGPAGGPRQWRGPAGQVAAHGHYHGPVVTFGRQPAGDGE